MNYFSAVCLDCRTCIRMIAIAHPYLPTELTRYLLGQIRSSASRVTTCLGSHGSSSGYHLQEDSLYAGVPREATLSPAGSKPLADVLYRVGHCDERKILCALAS